MLIDSWLIRDTTPGAAQPEASDSWIAATAPGDTYLALHRAGRLPDPLRDENQAACAWVEDREWWWRASFSAPEAGPNERLSLVFEGLDTHASIWMDGELLGTSRNMFLPARFDISARVRTGTTHTLLVRFTPPAIVTAEQEAPSWVLSSSPTALTKRNLQRKAQFAWGWDFAPRMLGVGIWQPVRLERHHRAVLSSVAVRTMRIDSDVANVEIEFEVDAFDAQAGLSARIQVQDPDGATVADEICECAAPRSKVALRIANPRLWWTADIGEQPLYVVTATLSCGSEVVGQRTLRSGLRTITIDTGPDPDEPGTTFFRFILNGVPLFARGANWVPASVFLGALTEEDTTSLVERAIGANMNMIRVWGGGIYESDDFFDACDRLGVLVWQDFMFACARYPEDDPSFVASVREEVAFQIKRLRHHPSLAVWCGNNECQVIQQISDHLEGCEPSPLMGKAIFEELMPKIVDELDPTTPYWPSSPFGGANANSMRAGDEHNWTVWHGIPPVPDDRLIGVIDRSPESIAYTRYAEDTARFVSEFGIQASPALATLQRWVNPEALELGSPAFLNRIKDKPPNKVDGMLVLSTGLPATLQEYVDFTQWTQAEGLKFGIEHFRRRMPHCSGALIWQFNDCWPGVSWSLVDYDRACKGAYFAVKRAYAPVIATFKQLPDGSVELWVTSNDVRPSNVSCTIEMTTLSGPGCWSESIALEVAPYTSRAVWRADPDRLAAAPDRVLTLRSAQVPANRMFFAPFKDLPLRRPELQMRTERIDEAAHRVTVTSDVYACFVHLLGAEPTATFSDNYFDLRPGESREILVTSAEGSDEPGFVHLRSLVRN